MPDEPLIPTEYTIYRPDGTEERGSVDWPQNPDLLVMRKFVGEIVDGPIEHVRVLASTKVYAPTVSRADYRDMFVDEQSHLRRKPRNEAATEIYRGNWLRVHPDEPPEALPWIAGTAIVFDRPVWT